MALTDEKPVEQSTFDVVKVHELHNTRFWTVLAYLGSWFIIFLKLAILGADTYTCVSILAFDRWSSEDVQVYEFKVAKWIFTGCIIFRFLLLAWQIAWAIHIYRTHNIALAYLNNYAALMYKVRSYDYHCLFNAIEMQGFLEWAAFFIYFNLDDALEVMVADLPRQVINVLTLKNYATDGSNNVLENIKGIATTNVRLAVVLSVQLLSVVIFAFFFFRFVFAMLLFIPLKVKVSDKGFRLFKAFCYLRVNDKVRFLVSRNHKPRAQLLAEGIMDAAEIRANPLLASLSTFDLAHPVYKNMAPYDQLAMLLDDLLRDYSRPARTYASSLRDVKRPFARPFERSGSASSLTEYPETSSDPFSDGRYESNPLLAPARGENPFADSTPLVAENPFVEKLKSLGIESRPEVLLEWEFDGDLSAYPQTLGQTHTLGPKSIQNLSLNLLQSLTPNKSLNRRRPGEFTAVGRIDTVQTSTDPALERFRTNRFNTDSLHAQDSSSHGAQDWWTHVEAHIPDPEDVTSPLLEQMPVNPRAPYPERGVSRYFEDDEERYSG